MDSTSVAGHRAIDCGDGWYVVRDVPILGAVAKGTKGAPEDVDEKWLSNTVDLAQREHREAGYAAPIHKGHHKPIDIQDPEFLGFVLPKRVDKAKVADGNGETAAVIADVKLTREAFERAKDGKLPYISAEVDWQEKRIASVAMLDSKPPHFRFPNFRIAEVVQDPAAKFEATLKSAAKFADDHMRYTNRANAQMDADYEKRMSSVEERVAKLERAIGLGGVMDKPDAKPADPTEIAKDQAEVNRQQEKAKMEADQKILAQFAAYEARIAAGEARIAALEREREEAKAKQALAERVAKAKADLRGYILPEDIDAKLTTFAKDETVLSAFVETYKKGVPRVQPKDVEEMAVDMGELNDPVLAKFQKAGPLEVEKAAKFLAQWRQLKQAYGDKLSSTAEQFVDFQMKATG